MSWLDPNRRQFLTQAGRTVAFTGTLNALPKGLGATEANPMTRRFRVRETAGLRRFGYPVHAILTLESVPEPHRFRLVHNGQPVPAQFTSIAESRQVLIAFNVSLGPGEVQEYTVELGPEVDPGPAPRGGIGVERTEDGYRIHNGTALSWDLASDLKGLFRASVNGGQAYLHPDSEGLSVRFRDGRTGTLHFEMAGAEQPDRIIERGPLRAALQFPGEIRRDTGDPIPCRVALAFPNSKSWFELLWEVTAPASEAEAISELEMGLHLRVEGKTTLVDLGANATVYGTLKTDEWMELTEGPVVTLNGPPTDRPRRVGEATIVTATPVGPEGVVPQRGRWLIRHGKENHLEPFASAAPAGLPPAEGWAHVMDSRRCGALAVDRFGVLTEDQIRVAADGRIAVRRRFPERSRVPLPRALRAWLHVVPMPVQVGAVTSPQAMRAPLVVEWSEPSR